MAKILSKKHSANTTENILLLLTFRNYTYLIIKADLWAGKKTWTKISKFEITS